MNYFYWLSDRKKNYSYSCSRMSLLLQGNGIPPSCAKLVTELGSFELPVNLLMYESSLTSK